MLSGKKILILDFGSQYTQLIARRIREQNVFCEIKPWTTELVFDDELCGVILSGSLINSVAKPDILKTNVWELLWSSINASSPVESLPRQREYGRTT